MRPLNIAVIGGSIAGCAAAIPLIRAGHKVTVYERSVNELSDRGAGIVIPKPLLEYLQNLEMFDSDMPYVALNSMDYNVMSDAGLLQGRKIWERPLEGCALRWGHLYQQLRKRIADQNYREGLEVVEIEPQKDNGDNAVSLLLSNGERHDVDLAIACDGVYSLARAKLSPKSTPQYAGYVLWRGLIEAPHEFSEALTGRVNWYPYEGGLAGFYGIANKSASTFNQSIENTQTINWGIYDKIDDTLLASLLPDLDVTKPSAFQLSESAVAYLHRLASDNIHSQAAELIKKTKAPFIQPIVDVVATQLVDQRLVLLGDAAAVLRPHTASGAVKAIQNGLSLSEAINQCNDLDATLGKWQLNQLEELDQQVSLSNALGEGWITKAPEWEKMDEHDMNAWWEAMVNGRSWYLHSK